MSDEAWDAGRAAVTLDRNVGRVGWPMIRRMLRTIREEFVRRHTEEQKQTPEERPGLLEWGKKYLPDHFSKPASPMHRWMAERLDAMDRERGSKLNVLGPRGGAKSTLGTLAFPLRAALEEREPYIWIVSDTKEQARLHLENLKAELVDNQRLARDYPRAFGRGPVWRAGAIVLKNGATIEAFGTGQRVRGRRKRENRPTLILCDDLENDGHIQSPLQREHSRTWFHGALLKAGSPLTNVVNLATALHREALAMELCETPGWTSRVFRAIEPWPRNMTFWEEWESLYADPKNPLARETAREFYERHRAAMDAGAAVLWPEVENLYALMCLRAESGRSAFEREKQNSPVSPELCEWPESYFGDHLWFEDWPRNLAVKVLALDPSKGSDARRGDYSAFVRLGLDRQGVLYVEADLGRRPVPEIVAAGVEHYRQFRPDAFGVEANQFQELLGAEIEAEFRRQGMLGIHPWLIHNEVNKRVRIRRLGPHLAGRRMRMKADSPSTLMLVDQLRQFPTADHDDGPDALEMAIRLAEEMLAGVPDDGLGSRLPVG
jgi:predicted phage terminase large subunit-like protein